MTPAARVQAAIEVLDRINSGTPAEQALTGWARGARYAGSKDRAAVRDHVFQTLRCRRSYAALGGADDGRALLLGHCRAENIPPDEIFTGIGHAPTPLTAEESTAGHIPEPGPEALDLPDWLWPQFTASLGEEGAMSAAALLQHRAPVALRVNARMNSAPEVTEILKESGIEVEASDLVDTALIVTEGARRVKSSRAYLEGRVELQDAASQAAMAALDVTSGAHVLDFCAGGGGKALALAARLDGHWYAHDAAPVRMRDLPERAARAGVSITCLEGSEPEDNAPFDLVLCDVPCSGSGTWRRAPDAKWRLTEAELQEYGTTQRAILDRAQALVRPGGRLVYTTCSVLDVENAQVVEDFLAKHPDWTLSFTRIWPVAAWHDGFYLAVFSAPE